MSAQHTPLSSVERVMLDRLLSKWACMTATAKEIERCQSLYNRDRMTRPARYAAKATGSAT